MIKIVKAPSIVSIDTLKIPLNIDIKEAFECNGSDRKHCVVFVDKFYINQIKKLERVPYFIQSIFGEPLVKISAIINTF